MTTSFHAVGKYLGMKQTLSQQLTLFRCVDCSRGLDELKRLIIQAIIRW